MAPWILTLTRLIKERVRRLDWVCWAEGARDTGTLRGDLSSWQAPRQGLLKVLSSVREGQALSEVSTTRGDQCDHPTSQVGNQV